MDRENVANISGDFSEAMAMLIKKLSEKYLVHWEHILKKRGGGGGGGGGRGVMGQFEDVLNLSYKEVPHNVL